MEVLHGGLDQKPPYIVIQNAIHYTHPGSTAMAAVDSSEGQICTWILQPPKVVQWNMDY